jgi:hypothetical protein
LGCMYIGSEKPKPALHTSVYPWFIACLYANFYLVIFPRKMFKLTDAVSLVLGAAVLGLLTGFKALCNYVLFSSQQCQKSDPLITNINTLP